MSNAIKPPGAPGATPGAAGPEDTPRTGAAGGAAGPSEAFRDELSKAAEAQPSSSVNATEATAPSARSELRALAAELRAGSIEPGQAIDQLVQRASSIGPAALLPAARRAELEAALRAALEEDPTLLAMQKDLARGR